MRVTAATKAATYQRILESAAERFAQGGWEATTTREIAEAARIATGTLFNYFPTKEALAATLGLEKFALARRKYDARRRGDESLDEDLFAYVWEALRAILPQRSYLAPALLGILTARPTSAPSDGDGGSALRAAHMEGVAEIVARHGLRPLTAVQAQLYWSLYLGVLAQWSADGSDNQEDTLALLDQALLLWIAALRKPPQDARDWEGL